MRDILKRAKENLLADAYGKYDLVETIIPLEKILKAKPRQLKKEICTLLELDIKQINYSTFSTWLNRFRKKHTPKNTPERKMPNSGGDSISGDWRHFNPSDPQADKAQGIVLKPIEYNGGS